MVVFRCILSFGTEDWTSQERSSGLWAIVENLKVSGGILIMVRDMFRNHAGLRCIQAATMSWQMRSFFQTDLLPGSTQPARVYEAEDWNWNWKYAHANWHWHWHWHWHWQKDSGHMQRQPLHNRLFCIDL